MYEGPCVVAFLQIRVRQLGSDGDEIRIERQCALEMADRLIGLSLAQCIPTLLRFLQCLSGRLVLQFEQRHGIVGPHAMNIGKCQIGFHQESVHRKRLVSNQFSAVQQAQVILSEAHGREKETAIEGNLCGGGIFTGIADQLHLQISGVPAVSLHMPLDLALIGCVHAARSKRRIPGSSTARTRS